MPKKVSSSSIKKTKDRSSQRKPINLTCRKCRSRKIRCDGAMPACGICLAYGDECQYDKPPSLSQMAAMEAIITNLRCQNEELMNSLARLKGKQVIHSQTTENSTIDHELNYSELLLQASGSIQRQNVSSSLEGKHSFSTIGSNTRGTASTLLDDDDRLPSLTDTLSRFTSIEPISWKHFVVESCAMHLQLSTETVRHLFDTHWTWVHATFMFVPESTFLQDAVAGGEHFSPLLLNTICLHSTRFTEHHLRNQLHLRAKMMVGQDLQNTPTIAYLQALLQLSAHEFGRGFVSLAWMYSGMAYRLAIELGIADEVRCNPNDLSEVRRIKIRQQLSWSCYLWDKIMSLYLGRMPTQLDVPSYELSFACLEEENELWPPIGSEVKLKDTSFKSVPSMRVACFENFCKLAVIMSDILVNVYGNKANSSNVSTFLCETQLRLERWRSQSMAQLKIESDANVCPPPHVVVQNMLYHTTIILLHRPFRAIHTSQLACTEASIRTEQCLLLFEKTFGLDKGTYAMAYSIYIAATVAVQDLIGQNLGTSDRIQTFLRGLESIKASCPGIERSIEVISKYSSSSSERVHQQSDSNHLSTLSTQELLNSSATTLSFQEKQTTGFDQLPPFPLANMSYSNFPTNEAGVESETVINPFVYLNSFPSEWSTFIDQV